MVGTLTKAANLPIADAPADAAFDMKATLDKFFSNLPDDFGTITPTAMKDQMGATKVFVVDIREASEIARVGYVEGAVNIPIRSFLKNLDKLPAKDQLIVVMCASGHRSALGMQALRLLGHTNVKSLAGGFNAWKAASLPFMVDTQTHQLVLPAANALLEMKAESESQGSTCAILTPMIKAKLSEIDSGQVLEVRVNDPTAREDIASWSRLSGNALLAMVEEGPAGLRFFLKKK